MIGLLAWATCAVLAFVLLIMLFSLRMKNKEYAMEDIARSMQGLLDRMKEYELDTRAGLLICRGPKLRIQHIDPNLEDIIGRPKFVEDILPENFRETHKKLIARFVRDETLPSSLNHPLRNLQLLNKDKAIILVRVVVGVFATKRSCDSSMFYAIIQPNEANFSVMKLSAFPSSSSFSTNRRRHLFHQDSMSSLPSCDSAPGAQFSTLLSSLVPCFLAYYAPPPRALTPSPTHHNHRQSPPKRPPPTQPASARTRGARRTARPPTSRAWSRCTAWPPPPTSTAGSCPPRRAMRR